MKIKTIRKMNIEAFGEFFTTSLDAFSNDVRFKILKSLFNSEIELDNKKRTYITRIKGRNENGKMHFYLEVLKFENETKDFYCFRDEKGFVRRVRKDNLIAVIYK